jgi:hypothetical protein
VFLIASAYGYTDVAALEAVHKVDYETMDATYTDANVEATISQAERWVNEYCGQSFTGTIPDGVTFATLEMAKFLMNQQMVDDGHLEKLPISLRDVLQICKEPLEKSKVSVSYSGSASDYYLANREG